MENPASVFDTGHLLTTLLLIPFIGMLMVAGLRHPGRIRVVALACSLLTLGVACKIWANFDYGMTGLQFTHRVPFPLGFFEYAVGVDGISLPLVLLTSLLIPLCMLASWRIKNPKPFMLLILMVEFAVIGVFTAADAFLFLLFWEAAMIPMYFVIAFWGGPGRTKAAIKFLLFSVGGSLLLSFGVEALHHFGETFDMAQLAQQVYAPEVQLLIFVPVFLGFAIKVPMLLVHGWIADAHGEAPAAGSAILSGLLLKMGAYGLLRFCVAILPEASQTFAPLAQWLSVLAILYGGSLALAQSDFKRLIAYSSIAHMGFVTLGIFGLGMQSTQGALMQMVNHGITTGALFLLAGMLYERTHDRTINHYGGLHEVMPGFARLATLFTVASFGLPGTGSFIGEFLVLSGTVGQSPPMVLLVLLGIVLGAAYMLWMFQRLVLGPVKPYVVGLPDLTRRERAAVIPLAILVFTLGLYPRLVLDLTETTVTALVQTASQAEPLALMAALRAP